MSNNQVFMCVPIGRRWYKRIRETGWNSCYATVVLNIVKLFLPVTLVTE